jgi:hypothetical protein
VAYCRWRKRNSVRSVVISSTRSCLTILRRRVRCMHIERWSIFFVGDELVEVEQEVVAYEELCCGRHNGGDFEDPPNVIPTFVSAFRSHRSGRGTMYCWLLDWRLYGVACTLTPEERCIRSTNSVIPPSLISITSLYIGSPQRY